ncbi:MAG: hypothetical protein DRH37_04670, partial [Deltaproteobacteria bacterium]
MKVNRDKTGDVMSNLEVCRDKIDAIDSQIISLLSRRQEIATEVGRIKKAH